MKGVALLLVALVPSLNAVAQTPVHRTESISIGGIRQFISIKGKDNTRPVLLFLHGGPGGSVMGYADKFTDKLQAHFIVVQWDQRETGRTQAMNRSPRPLTLLQFENDTRALIDTLLRRFNQPKLYLAAHSWGTFLGFQIAGKYPSLLHAYIPIAPMIHQVESERIALAMMIEKATNEKEQREFQNIRVPFENGEQLYLHRKGLQALMRVKTKLSRDHVLSWAGVWLPLFNEASQVNMMEAFPQIHCPVYFIAGRNDLQTNASLSESYYRRLIAPVKKFYWFDRAAHAIPSSASRLLQEVIIQNVLAETSGKPGS